MRTFIVLLSLMFSSLAFAVDPAETPLSPQETARLQQFTNSPYLGDCMASYKFDFFSDQLGLSTGDKEVLESELNSQLRKYLKTGKLDKQNPTEIIAARTAQRCDIIAQTMIEAWSIKMRAHANDGQ